MTRDPMHSRHVLMLRAACWTKAAPIPAGCPVRQTRWALRRFVSLKTKQKPRCSCVTEAACRHCAPLPARGAKTCFLPRRCGPPFIRCCPAPRQSLCACAVPHTTGTAPHGWNAAVWIRRTPSRSSAMCTGTARGWNFLLRTMYLVRTSADAPGSAEGRPASSAQLLRRCRPAGQHPIYKGAIHRIPYRAAQPLERG